MMNLQYLCSFLLVVVTVVLAKEDPIAESQSSGKEIRKDDLFGPPDQPEPKKSDKVFEGFEPQEFSESDLKEVSEPEVTPVKKLTRVYTVIPATPLIKPIESNKDTQTSPEEKTEVGVPSTDYKPPVDGPSADQELTAESRTEEENVQDEVKHPLSAGSIRGIPGVDFPDYEEIPMSSFECTDKEYFPGFYADMETGCQVFHVCYQERRESFLCPVGTIFNQAILTCDNWYSSNCSFTPSFYSSNAGIGDASTDETTETTPDSHDQGTEGPPTTESYPSSESPSEGDGEYFHFGGIHPLHSKRICPEKFTNETKIVAEASVGGRRKNKHPTQQPGKTPHPTIPPRPYPTKRTRPTKTTTTTTTTRKPYTTTTTTRKPTYKPHTTTTQKPYEPPTTRRPTTTRRPYSLLRTRRPPTRDPYQRPSVHQDVSDALEIDKRILEHVRQTVAARELINRVFTPMIEELKFTKYLEREGMVDQYT